MLMVSGNEYRNSLPPTTTADNLAVKVQAAQGQVHVDVAFWGGIIPGNQVIAFKLLLCRFSNGRNVENAPQRRHLSARISLCSYVFAENGELGKESGGRAGNRLIFFHPP